VTFSNPDGSLVLVDSTGLVSVTGDGSVANPLVLTGAFANINIALGKGLTFSPVSTFRGTTLLKMVSNDAGNTGAGGPKTDTDYLPITIAISQAQSVPPKVVAVYADSTAWSTDFRDYVDGGFTDPSAVGYRIPNGTLQEETLPWVNINRLKVVFSEDVGASLNVNDFVLSAAPGWLALGNPVDSAPTVVGFAYDSSTFTVTLLLSKVFSAAVVDLKIGSAGVTNGDGTNLDGEWVNGVTPGSSGDGAAGGDFSYRIFVLPGDTVDESGGLGTRTVNTNDSQQVRDLQNGLALKQFGAFGYDPRADLDGSSVINTNE
jgi:hypothetical protein